MSQLFISIIGGVVVAIIAAWFGIGGTTRVVVHGARPRKTGKWIILIAVIMIFFGVGLLSKNMPPNGGAGSNIFGTVLVAYGFLFLIVGKVVAWFQRS